MFKYLFILLFPMLLLANLTYQSNYNKELALLESFDIEASFLYDPVMNDMRNKNANANKHKQFFKAMNEAYLFIPAMKNILTKYNVPQEFLYLAMAESNFSNKAYSSKRASGLWQFMPATGKIFDLHIDEYVDERRDLIKSSEAAAQHLSALHKQFGKWYLAAIAYNCGGGKLGRAIIEARSDDLSILLDPKKKYIPRESRLYIRKIVALALMGTDEQFLLSSEYEYLLNRANAYPVSTVKLPSGESLSRVAKLIDLPLPELQKLNRHLKYDFTPPYAKSYDVYIPYIKLSDFKQKYHERVMGQIYKVYTVKRGDNLLKIAKNYGITYKLIMDFNKLKNSNLGLNQKLIIPIASNRKSVKISSDFYHIVKKGDSLESISKAYKVSVANIKAQNHINGSLIKMGDWLKIYE